jgi:hypothetical protein
MEGWLKNVHAGQAISPFGARGEVGADAVALEGRELDVGISSAGRMDLVPPRTDRNCCGMGISSFLGTPQSTHTGAEESLALGGLL